MKKTFSKYKRLLIAFLLVFIPLMGVSTFKIDYSITAPGFNEDISSFIVIEEAYHTSSSFHTTSVVVLDGVTILQYLLGNIENTVTVENFPDYYDNLDLNDLDKMSYLMKDDSLFTSLLVGIEYAGYNVNYATYLTVYLTFDYLTPDSLMIGDKILEINGSIDYENAISDIQCNDVVEFKILRNNEEMTVHAKKNELDDGSCSLGVYLAHYTEIIDTTINYEIIDTNIGGPSGGLMQALFIYNQLSENDLAPGLKIAGTGTISIDGTVGYIGGVKQKIITASLNNIDIFFIPHLTDEDDDNYIEALEIYNQLETDMILVGVSSFEEALEYLLNYQVGDVNE